MSQINLNQYIEQIKSQVEKGRYAEVIAHCRQILKSYPRYIEAYRLMGNALAAQKAFKDAENVLYRVLSIDVSDFWSHRNLAQVFADTNQMEKAIWHIEHAFEIDPNNISVAESREQYYRRAALTAPIVKGMPLASVARLYVKGGIYDQAIEELNRMLAHNPDRLDWKTLLAIAYWREGKNADALQLAENILEKLPNNYYARLVLGDIWWHNGRNDIANGHLDILQQILLVDSTSKDQFPLAAPVLETSGKIGQPFLIEPLNTSGIDWDHATWQSSDQEANTESEEYSDILSNLDSDSDAGRLVITEDDSLISEFELDYDKESIGTGPLDSFTNDTDPIVDGIGDADDQALNLADDPDPISDSELNKLPNIDNLMTAELDHAVNEDEATLESISDELDALSVSSIEELAELDKLHRSKNEDDVFNLTEEDFGLGLSDEDFGLTEDNGDDFFIDLTLDEPLEAKESAEPELEDAPAEILEDSELGFSDQEQEEFILTAEAEFGSGAITEKNEIPDVSEELAFTDTDSDDSLEWLDQDLPDDIFEENQSFLDDIYEDEAPDLSENTGAPETAETNTGFTDWLEAVDIPLDPAESEQGDLKDLFKPINESTDSLPAEVEDASDVHIDAFAGDGSDDAYASGLFDFLSDEENQLNPLPEPKSIVQDDAVDSEIKESNWEIDFDEFEVDDDPRLTVDSESSDGVDLAFLEEVQSADDRSDDPFDTSWLDGELTEEIDLLSEQSQVDEPEPAAEEDLRSFAEKLDGDFDRLAPSDSGSSDKPDFEEEVENVFESKTQLDPSDPDISAEAADLNEMLELANDQVRNATSSPEEDIEALIEDLAESEPVAKASDVMHDEEPQNQVLEVNDDDKTSLDSSLDWLIPDGVSVVGPTQANDEEDLAWLSLLDDGIPEQDEGKIDRSEPKLPWTGDLSSAASSILMPESEHNKTKELSEEESPDWLNDLPEYNTPSKQTDKLESNLIDEEEGFTNRFDDEDSSEEENLDVIENDQDFDPIVFQESSSKQLPEWLADATLSASLGYEPESTIDADSDKEKSDEISEPVVETVETETEEEDAEKRETVSIEKASLKSEISLEDELDMEFDKNGNPIPPESQDLEDTLNWLEELATIDLEDSSSKIAINSKDSQAKTGDPDLAKAGSQNDDPLSEIFSGGSALHAFANLETGAPDLGAEDAAIVEDQAEVSKETLNWLDNLFAPASSSNSEATEDVPNVAEPVEIEPELELPDDLFNEVETENIAEILDSEPLTVVDEATENLSLENDEVELSEDIFAELSEESILDIELSDAEIEADIPAINLETSDLPDLTAIQDDVDLNDVVSQSVDSSIVVDEQIEPPSRGGGLFGMDDITVSQEEISHAVESGEVVPGMEDIPDDPDALMAWLNLEPEESPEPEPVETVDLEGESVVEAEIELSENLVEPVTAEAPELQDEPETADLATEVTDLIVDQAEKVVPEAPKKPSMFGDADDITVSKEEISRAVEHGDVVPGMEDIPDDPDALMAWLDLSPLDDETDDDAGLGFDVTDEVKSSEADLIIADLGQDSEPVLEAKVGTSELNLDSLDIDEGLDDLFDDIAGPEGTGIEDEDLIFGDLGTGRLSGSDWLDQMTFDSDPALLGDVPTVLPSAPDLAEIVDEVTDKGTADDALGDALNEIEADNSEIPAEPVEGSLEAEATLPSLEELPDDPDEFIRILESNVDEPEMEEDDENAPLPVSFDDELDEISEASSAVDQAAEEIPDWLKVDEQESDPALPWLDDASSSGVMSWLDADQAIKEQGLDGLSLEHNGAELAVDSKNEDASVESVEASIPIEDDKSLESIFDADLADPEDDFSSKIEEYKKQLSEGEDLPTLIRQIRESLAVKNDPTLQKILGDAYMESGQLQDALDAYRQAQRLL